MHSNMQRRHYLTSKLLHAHATWPSPVPCRHALYQETKVHSSATGTIIQQIRFLAAAALVKLVLRDHRNPTVRVRDSCKVCRSHYARLQIDHRRPSVNRLDLGPRVALEGPGFRIGFFFGACCRPPSAKHGEASHAAAKHIGDM